MMAAASTGLRQSLNRLSPKPEKSIRVTGTRGDAAAGPKLLLNVSSIGVSTVVVVTPPARALCSCTAEPANEGEAPLWGRNSGRAARRLIWSPPLRLLALKLGCTSLKPGEGMIGNC